jgi:hypothetical protein
LAERVLCRKHHRSTKSTGEPFFNRRKLRNIQPALTPIESAFNFEGGLGWRAAELGEQQIRIIFDHPTPIRRIQLHFVETTVERTQEFTLRWSSVRGGPMKEIVRQQWNFSPTGSTHEVEDYHVELKEVSALELAIKPDLTCEKATAGLPMWRVA